VSHLKVAFTQTSSIDLISHQPLPDYGHIPGSPLRSGQPSRHNSRVPRNADPQSFDSSRLSLRPRSHSCPSYIQPLAILSTSAVSRATRGHDPLSAFLRPPRSLSTRPTSEEQDPVPFEVVRIEPSSGISESRPHDTRPHDTCIPIWYGISYRNLPFKASFSATLSGSQREAFLIFPQMSNTASPPAEPGVYLIAN
jgi:hypothetical protein